MLYSQIKKTETKNIGERTSPSLLLWILHFPIMEERDGTHFDSEGERCNQWESFSNDCDMGIFLFAANLALRRRPDSSGTFKIEDGETKRISIYQVALDDHLSPYA